MPMATKSVDSDVTAALGPVLAAATATVSDKVEGPAVRPVEQAAERPAQPQSRLHRVKHFIPHKVAPVCFVLWGCVILVVHIYSTPSARVLTVPVSFSSDALNFERSSDFFRITRRFFVPDDLLYIKGAHGKVVRCPRTVEPPFLSCSTTPFHEGRTSIRPKCPWAYRSRTISWQTD